MLLKGVEHEPGIEGGLEQQPERAVHVEALHRLPHDADAQLRRRLQVVPDLHRASLDQLSAAILGLMHPLPVAAVEDGMRDGEDETAAGPQQPGRDTHQRFDLRHVHQRHVADDRVELPLAQRDERLLAGRIDLV